MSLPLVGVLIYVGGWPLAVATAVIAALAGAEFVHGWLLPSLPIPGVAARQPAFILTSVVVLAAHWEAQAVPAGAACALVAAAAGFGRTNRFGPRKPYRVVAGCILYLGVPLSTLVLIRDGDDGRQWLFLGILSTFAVDTGAYTVGRLFGRHRMAPKISPGKTWEGAIGGYVAGAAAVFALNAAFATGVSATTIAVLAVPVPAAAILGDLLESWMKRRMGVKDSSGLLPGHGGFLDRLDSVLLVMPVLYLFLQTVVL